VRNCESRGNNAPLYHYKSQQRAERERSSELLAHRAREPISNTSPSSIRLLAIRMPR
jgi:hypothetical protein